MPGNRSVPAPQVTESPPRRQASPADSCAMVIFGATGDLTKRLVIPALYNLACTKVLPEKFALIGVARSVGTVENWRNHLYKTLKSFVGNAATEFDVDHIDDDVWKQLADRMSCVQGDLTKPELYEKLCGALDEAERAHGTAGNAIFYLAVADRLFGTVVDQLGKAKLADQHEDQGGKRRFWRRVVIEKPFGHSLDFGTRTECAHQAHAERRPDLPDRPFSREGHGPEHHGLSFCQWAVRTALEL